MKRLLTLAAALCTLAVVAPGASASASCPVGHSTMGCSQSPALKGISAPPAGEIVPDVSSYQGTVDWAKVAAWQKANGWTPGAIFKLGEITLDPDAIRNADGLRAAGMLAIGYVFVRPGLEASTVIGWAKDAGIKVVVLDEEVSGIQGIAGRITPALKGAGLTVVDYHSADNVDDTTADGLDCWVADYGPSTPPACSTGPEVAWQFTDLGVIPGISGIVDESINYGLLQLAAPVVKRLEVCWGAGALSDASCTRFKAEFATWNADAHRLKSYYAARDCTVAKRKTNRQGCGSLYTRYRAFQVEAHDLKAEHTA